MQSTFFTPLEPQFSEFLKETLKPLFAANMGLQIWGLSIIWQIKRHGWWTMFDLVGHILCRFSASSCITGTDSTDVLFPAQRAHNEKSCTLISAYHAAVKRTVTMSARKAQPYSHYRVRHLTLALVLIAVPLTVTESGKSFKICNSVGFRVMRGQCAAPN